MRDDVHAYAENKHIWTRPRRPFTVVERLRGGLRSDLLTKRLDDALARRDELRRSGRGSYIRDADGRRVEGW